MTPEERTAALMPLGRVLLAALERHAAAKAARAVAEGRACWLPWAAPVPPPPAFTDDDLRKRPRYRGSRRRS